MENKIEDYLTTSRHLKEDIKHEIANFYEETKKQKDQEKKAAELALINEEIDRQKEEFNVIQYHIYENE